MTAQPALVQEAPAAGIVLRQRSLSHADLVGKLRCGRSLIIALVDKAKLTGFAAGAAGGFPPYSGGSAKSWEAAVDEEYLLDAAASAPVRRTRSAHSYTGNPCFWWRNHMCVWRDCYAVWEAAGAFSRAAHSYAASQAPTAVISPAKLCSLLLPGCYAYEDTW